MSVPRFPSRSYRRPHFGLGRVAVSAAIAMAILWVLCDIVDLGATHYRERGNEGTLAHAVCAQTHCTHPSRAAHTLRERKQHQVAKANWLAASNKHVMTMRCGTCKQALDTLRHPSFTCHRHEIGDSLVVLAWAAEVGANTLTHLDFSNKQ